MFNIAMYESGNTCNSEELVKGRSAPEVGNARKRKYFCVTSVDGKHPLSLNVRHFLQQNGLWISTNSLLNIHETRKCRNAPCEIGKKTYTYTHARVLFLESHNKKPRTGAVTLRS